MMKQDGKHIPEEAIPVVNGEVTEPSSPGVVEHIVPSFFSIYRNDETRWPAQSGGSYMAPIVNGEVTEPSSPGVVEHIVPSFFSIYRNDETRWPAQSRGSNTYSKW